MRNCVPANWEETTLASVAKVNPANPDRIPDDAEEVSFIPMANVEAGTGRLHAEQTRSWGEVKKGYKRFQEGDVLFAKITPCMENGKVALATGLLGRVGAGSTEYHVLRPTEAIDNKLLTYYLLQEGVRRDARAQMTGTAGQLRVPSLFLEAHELLLPPRAEQHRIVEAIESYLTRLDDAVASLERVQRNLERYRASVLKAAVEGRLVPTEAELAGQEGRSYEPASVLLKRILAERKTRWIEDAAEKARAKAETRALKAGKPWTPEDAAKALEKARKTAEAKYKEPAPPDLSALQSQAGTTDLPTLPEGWCWTTWDQIGFAQNGRAFPSKEYSDTGIRLLRPGNLHVSGTVEWTEKNTRLLPEKWALEYPSYVIGSNELVMNLTAQSLADQFLGRICLTGANERCLLNQRIARLKPILIEPRFLLWLFKTPLFRRFVDSLNTGSLIQHMFTSQLAEALLPLPPSAEQARLTDAIESAMTRVISIARSAEAACQRIPVERQAILKWAFEGHLVEQDPNDEPASVLLERIKAERASGPAGVGQ